MKLISAIAAHFLIGVVLAWGILRIVHGHPLLLIVASLGYVLMFAKLGCLPKTGH